LALEEQAQPLELPRVLELVVVEVLVVSSHLVRLFFLQQVEAVAVAARSLLKMAAVKAAAAVRTVPQVTARELQEEQLELAVALTVKAQL
jgi:hypothetical protein